MHVKWTYSKIIEFYNCPNNVEAAKNACKLILEAYNLNEEDVDEEYCQKLIKRIGNLYAQYDKRWKKSFYNKTTFQRHNESWLNTEFKIEPPERIVPIPSTSTSGRPTLQFQAKGRIAKQMDSKTLSEALMHDSQRLVAAGAHAARKSGEHDLAAILTESIGTPTRSKKVRRKLFSPVNEATVYSPEEGLALILDLSLSKEQYVSIRDGSRQKGVKLYPSYYSIAQIKKAIRTTDIEITETVAKVSLQSLLDNTAQRILEMQEEGITNYSDEAQKMEWSATLLCSWGFDGTSGMSEYKQKYHQLDQTDSFLFATTLVPLRLMFENLHVAWINRTPQSIRFCRPVKLEYVKETKSHILKERDSMIDELNNLEPFTALVANRKIQVGYSLSMTLIDGKVLNVITATPSSMMCPICKAKPTQFNNLENITKQIFNPVAGSLNYGISPLHAWIRLYECLLKISYKQCVKQWQVRDSNKKKQVAEAKSIIRENLWKEIGLRVDVPKAGGSGTSNDGNSARRAFKESSKFADATKVNVDLIRRFRTILIGLSCQLPLDPEKFGEFCVATAQLYVSLYPWYPMPATVHKVLIHGKDIVLNSILPVGMLGEECSEALNKFYKKFRLQHARKSGSSVNLEDIFNRVLDCSDPIISTLSLNTRFRKQNKSPIPDDVKKLLVDPDSESESSEDDTEVDNITGLPETFMYLDNLELSEEEN